MPATATTRLSRALAERPPRRATPVDLFRLARRRWLGGERVDVGALAAELGIGRATAFRWVGSRELLLGEILWSLCAPLLGTAAESARGRGARRVASICAAAIRAILRFAPLRAFIAQDPEYALRLLTSKLGPVQARSVEQVRALLEREVDRGALAPPLKIETLAYLIVRIAESFIYAEGISGEAIDVDDAELAIELLLSGRIARREEKPMTAHYATHDDIAVITLDNPPVNGMGLATRHALAAGIARAEADPTLRAIVIAGAGKVFSGGADIKEFGLPEALASPNLLEIIDMVEASAKPTVASLHGVCMGGGLELALGCHYRVASSDTQIGLPEVKIGLLPGAGGTQRLPRAVGLDAALAMIVSGDPRGAEALAALPGQRLLDRVVAGSPLESAIALAREAAARGGDHPRLRDIVVAHADPAGALAAARAKVAALGLHVPAPNACIDAIAGALGDFDSGIAAERAGFAALLATPASRALRHAFFAERAAARLPDVPDDTPKRRIEHVAVIGAGTMGSGIAVNFLGAGLPVTLIETNADALARGVAAIDKIIASAVKKGALSEADAGARRALLAPTLEFEALADADLVIEAVFEDLAVKEEVFRRIDAHAKWGAILASNTSTLDLDRIAAFTERPQDVIGLHFFSPAHVMKLLEIVRGRETAKDVLATAMALAKRIGKTAVVSGVCDGFIGNRMIEQYLRQAGFLLEEGALPVEVDAAMKAYGFAMGPFETSDLAGNDIGWAIRKRRYVERPEQTYSPIADRLCEMGRFGQKTGAGWYDYKPGDRAAYPNREVEQTIIEVSRERGIVRRAIGADEIVERLVYALVNEGARIVEEGIAAKAGDVDVVYLNGYGFPRFRGGPMRYADEVGLPEVLARIRWFDAADAEGRQAGAWTPAPLLVKLAAEGGAFT